MRSELRCTDVRPEISALLDDELGPETRAAVSAHLAACDECAAYAERIAGVRKLIRLQPVEQVPDLTARIDAALTTTDRPAAIRPYVRTAALAAAAALLVFLGTGVDLDRTPDVATAGEIVHEVRAAARDLTTYRAEFEIVERGWHPDVDVRSFTARVWFAAPERFRLELDDTTSYPGARWPRNDVTLVASERRWSISEPSACPVEALPACSIGATRDERTIVDRQPFDGNSALPTDIAVPLETLSDASALEVVDADAETYRVRMTYQQASPLVRALHQGGSWRPFHPLDPVELWIDRITWFPHRFRVLAGDSPDRELWAERLGLAPESPGRVLLRVDATRFEEPRNLDRSLFRAPVSGAVSSGGFDAFGTIPGGASHPVPGYLSGLSLYFEGATARSSMTAYTDGMTWLKVSTVPEEGAAGVFTSGAEIIDVGNGHGYYLPADERHGRRIEIYGASGVRVEGNLPRDELVRVAGSLPVTGSVPARITATDGTVTARVPAGSIPESDRPAYLPEGYRLAAAVRTKGQAAENLSLHFRPAQTSYDGDGIVVTRSTGYEGLPPSSEEFVNVRVGRALGRWSFERSELEWIEDSIYRAVAVPGGDLSTVLQVAESLG